MRRCQWTHPQASRNIAGHSILSKHSVAVERTRKNKKERKSENNQKRRGQSNKNKEVEKNDPERSIDRYIRLIYSLKSIIMARGETIEKTSDLAVKVKTVGFLIIEDFYYLCINKMHENMP